MGSDFGESMDCLGGEGLRSKGLRGWFWECLRGEGLRSEGLGELLGSKDCLGGEVLGIEECLEVEGNAWGEHWGECMTIGEELLDCGDCVDGEVEVLRNEFNSWLETIIDAAFLAFSLLALVCMNKLEQAR